MLAGDSATYLFGVIPVVHGSYSSPITLCAIAPLGLIIGNGLQFVINGIYGFAPWLAMMLFAGFMPFIVMTGMHWAFVPASMLGISGVGYDLM